MREANAYTDGASTGSRGPGGCGAVLTWKGKTVEISGERDTTNLSMELTAVCAALETIGEGHRVPSTPMRPTWSTALEGAGSRDGGRTDGSTTAKGPRRIGS